MMERSASSPSSVAQVTSQRTISRRRQFTDDSVIRNTWRHEVLLSIDSSVMLRYVDNMIVGGPLKLKST